jgi:hypothetical protein
MALISQYPAGASEAERAAFVGRQLGLVGPATADRELPVGELMPGAAGGGWEAGVRGCSCWQAVARQVRSGPDTLALPAHAAAAAGPGGVPAKERWRLAEVVEVLRGRYCSTLALEYKHLFQQVGGGAGGGGDKGGVRG